MYRVVLEVVEVRGECPAKYKVGEKMTFDQSILNLKETDRVCIYALSSVLPYVTALYRDTNPEDWINRKEIIGCPDPEKLVVFKVLRIPV